MPEEANTANAPTYVLDDDLTQRAYRIHGKQSLEHHAKVDELNKRRQEANAAYVRALIEIGQDPDMPGWDAAVQAAVAERAAEEAAKIPPAPATQSPAPAEPKTEYK